MDSPAEVSPDVHVPPLVTDPQEPGPSLVAPPLNRRTSSSSVSSATGKMHRACPSCHQGNQLATADQHDSCIACLGFNHLQEMATCEACQALCYKDRLERACRFT